MCRITKRRLFLVIAKTLYKNFKSTRFSNSSSPRRNSTRKRLLEKNGTRNKSRSSPNTQPRNSSRNSKSLRRKSTRRKIRKRRSSQKSCERNFRRFWKMRLIKPFIRNQSCLEPWRNPRRERNFSKRFKRKLRRRRPRRFFVPKNCRWLNLYFCRRWFLIIYQISSSLE